jgi:hypothetical protein
MFAVSGISEFLLVRTEHWKYIKYNQVSRKSHNPLNYLHRQINAITVVASYNEEARTAVIIVTNYKLDMGRVAQSAYRLATG